MAYKNRKRFYIFISHSWNFNEYQRIINFLDATPNFIYKNYSVPQERSIFPKNKSELKKALYSRIKLSQIVLIPAGMEINYREFILFELNIAEKMNKPIVGILPRGQKRIPRAICEIAVDIVGWSRKSILNAIKIYSL